MREEEREAAEELEANWFSEDFGSFEAANPPGHGWMPNLFQEEEEEEEEEMPSNWILVESRLSFTGNSIVEF
jgi:hypothetical protein